MDDATFHRGRRITMDELGRDTGISRSTLKRMANLRGYNVEISAVDALCRYFKCQPGDLLEYVPDGQVGRTRRR